MNIRINGTVGGEVKIPESKSQAHRLLICAALADKESRIECQALNDDIERTAECLNALGARITYENGIFTVCPIASATKSASLDCGESGSTLRFMLPVAAALGADATFIGRGRLPQRPLSPLYERMEEHGVQMSGNGKMPLICNGTLQGGEYEIAANISSQFISGLLFALPLTGEESSIVLQGKLESGSYIEMTLDALKMFGVEIERGVKKLIVHKGQKYTSPGDVCVEGDWSAAAFWLVAGVTGENPITCTGLNTDTSRQGDRAVVDMLKKMGGRIVRNGNDYTAYPSQLIGTLIDCHDTPDLVPALAVAAAFAEGTTTFDNIARLRIKESDRVATVCEMLASFGIKTESTENRLTVYGGKPTGGKVNSFGDHRIAMAGAVAGLAAEGTTEIMGAECVSKSYPAFFDHLKALGGEATQTEQ